MTGVNNIYHTQENAYPYYNSDYYSNTISSPSYADIDYNVNSQNNVSCYLCSFIIIHIHNQLIIILTKDIHESFMII